MTDKQFFSNMLYNAYMSDLLTDDEVVEACFRLNIFYPPEQHETKHETEYGTVASGMHNRSAGSQADNG